MKAAATDQVGEHGPQRISGRRHLGHPGRQAGLPDPARAQQGHQAIVVQRREYAALLGGPPDEGRPCRREADHHPGPGLLPRRDDRGKVGERAPVRHAELPQQRRHVTFDGTDGNVHPARDLRIAEVRSDRFEDFSLTLRHGRRVSSPLAHCIPTAAMAIMLNNRDFSRQGHFWRVM